MTDRDRETPLQWLADELQVRPQDLQSMLDERGLVLAERGNYPEIPDGWKLAPLKPSRHMIKRGRGEIGGGSTFTQEEREEMADEIYRAMLGASPAPPSEEAGKGGEE